MAVPACFNTRGDFIPPVSRRRRRRWDPVGRDQRLALSPAVVRSLCQPRRFGSTDTRQVDSHHRGFHRLGLFLRSGLSLTVGKVPHEGRMACRL